MNAPNEKESELQRREQELRDREMALRLRELEAEISPPPVMPTVKHDLPSSEKSQKLRNFLKTAKFIGLIVGAGILFVIVFRVGTFLASFVIVGIIGWVVYKLFFERDRDR